jgi:hypothetical protein
MRTKLTLTIEKEVIALAKEYAKENGQSLSGMVENYFKFIAEKKIMIKPETLSPRVQILRGILDAHEVKDDKQILIEELSKKYGF